jgi:hypothetical protein
VRRKLAWIFWCAALAACPLAMLAIGEACAGEYNGVELEKNARGIRLLNPLLLAHLFLAFYAVAAVLSLASWWGDRVTLWLLVAASLFVTALIWVLTWGKVGSDFL